MQTSERGGNKFQKKKLKMKEKTLMYMAKKK